MCVSKTDGESKHTGLGYDLDLSLQHRSHFLFLFASRQPGDTQPRTWNVWKMLKWKSLTSLSLLRWNKLKEKTWNSKIDWNNCCENNCHRNMCGQSGHILPVMNSKYMWCIRVTLMAQLCHEKIQTCTHGTGILCCKAGNKKTLTITTKYLNVIVWIFQYHLDSFFVFLPLDYQNCLPLIKASNSDWPAHVWKVRFVFRPTWEEFQINSSIIWLWIYVRETIIPLFDSVTDFKKLWL